MIDGNNKACAQLTCIRHTLNARITACCSACVPYTEHYGLIGCTLHNHTGPTCGVTSKHMPTSVLKKGDAATAAAPDVVQFKLSMVRSSSA